MLSTCPRMANVLPRGSSGRSESTHALHVGRHAAQVASLHVGVDLEHRLHVVVAHDRLGDAAVQAGDVAQELRLLLRRLRRRSAARACRVRACPG